MQIQYFDKPSVVPLITIVMGIGHIFKIDEHYPLNVFTNYNYSNSLLQEYA